MLFRPALILLAAAAGAPAEAPSWVFQPSVFTHDRVTGARVAQHQPLPAVEPLPDPRLVTSGYRRTRTTIVGPDGTIDSSYQVQSFANGRGGLDAEWERFADEWRASFLSGSFVNQNAFGPNGFGQPGFDPRFADPRFFSTPGFGVPGFGVPFQPFFGPAFGVPGFPGQFFGLQGFAPQGFFPPPSDPRFGPRRGDRRGGAPPGSGSR